MKAVLTILGIAIAAMAISFLLQPRKDLSPKPQDEAYERQQNEQKAEQEKALKDRKAQAAASEANVKFEPSREGVLTAVLTIEGKGDITMELYPKAAPKTVEQFARLIREGFYKGIKVHRVEPNFVVQMGDPKTKTGGADAPGVGTGGSGKNIPFETNDLPNVTGAVSMALSGARTDTADSQFFINLVYNKFLDKDYCVFGKVTQGMDVVNKTAKGDTIANFVVK